jgi:hypothetical protein
MDDRQLLNRPGKGWTRWAAGTGGYEIERIWWQARSEAYQDRRY